MLFKNITKYIENNLADLYATMPVIVQEWSDSASPMTSIAPALYVDRDRWEQLPNEEQEFIITHEMIHLVRRHHQLCHHGLGLLSWNHKFPLLKYGCYSKNTRRSIMIVACELTCNQLTLDRCLYLPNSAVFATRGAYETLTHPIPSTQMEDEYVIQILRQPAIVHKCIEQTKNYYN